MGIKALVPIMSSDTTPYGEVSCSSLWTSSGNYKAYYAFDGNDTTYWASANRAAGEWIQYEFTSPQRVTGLFIDAGNEGSTGDSYKLQYYNGSDWVDLTEYRNYGNGVSDRIQFSNTTESTKYRILFGGASTHNTRTLQLYGPDGHSSYIGDIEAIRDWLNASLYNKEEIEDLFIQNNSGLQAYDLIITNGEPEQFIKLIGQTSGKIYNVCLDEIVIPKTSWVEDSPYFIEDTSWFYKINNRSYRKTVAGKAYGAGCRYTTSNVSPIFVSDNPEFVKYTTSDGGSFSSRSMCRFGGKTWYIAGGSYGYSNTTTATILFTPDQYNAGYDWSYLGLNLLQHIYSQ